MAFVSIAVILITLGTCDFLRRQILLRLSPTSLARRTLADFFVSAELCAVAFELGAVLEHYGLPYWSVGLVLMTMYQVFRWKDCSFPNPCVHLLDFSFGRKSLSEFLLRSGVLLAAGLLAYRYVRAIWRLEMSSLHVGRPDAMDACSVPWDDVPRLHSFLAEFLGSLFLGIAPRLVLDNATLANNDLVYSAVIIGLLVLVTVVAAMDLSGGMFNPMLASVLLGGCAGHSMLEHFLIYWLGAAAGATLAFVAYPTVKKCIYGTEIESTQGKKKL